MLEAYAAGQPSVEEAKRLMELKEILEITFDDHFAVEADVRLELYVQSVEKQILNGEFNLKDTAALEELKQAFNISPDQAAKLEPYILSSFQRLAVKGKILIADDDVSLLKVLEMDLVSRGYQTVTCESVREALDKLSTVSVDLILSDIKFGPGEPDGFKFFASVQEQPHLRKIPFIFISALDDGVFVRSGAMLGADDYLTKPLDLDLLMAVIEGKLKRFRQMQK
jgi:PleD family two-component response regulator